MLIVVRRDASETFHRLQGTWMPKLGPDATLIWDRRSQTRRRYEIFAPVERRVRERRETDVETLEDCAEARRGDRRQQSEWRMPERRHTERRRRLPDTWSMLGFLVVGTECESS